ncbi:hypothetical protein Tcan_03930 [Toxocara canis]|uniref:Uncharacterized protein n=1 Tax=Toxocara canis TaxID=6265 RepID=A0A0B2VTA2_TOXCA|nr:hypothetical protein Tcan_03930 [Toxocara canis]
MSGQNDRADLSQVEQEDDSDQEGETDATGIEEKDIQLSLSFKDFQRPMKLLSYLDFSCVAYLNTLSERHAHEHLQIPSVLTTRHNFNWAMFDRVKMELSAPRFRDELHNWAVAGPSAHSTGRCFIGTASVRF